MKQNIKKLGYFLFAIFIVLIFYLTYLTFQKGEELATHPQNRRLAAKEAGIIRGTIYDRQGVKLAETRWSGQGGQRVYYTMGEVSPFAQVIGYVSERYGSSGLEAAYSKELLGLTEADAVKNLLDKILSRTPRGNDLVLTLDATLQSKALALLGNRRGAVVALDPRTGAILAMVSAPAFNSNAIKDDKVWQQLNQDTDNAPLLNRATQGAYPPGSVLKLVTGTAILANQAEAPNNINCPGYVIIDGNKITDNQVHGQVDFIKALAVSCNTYFAQEGVKLGWPNLLRTFEQFGLNQKADLEIPVRAGTFAEKERRNKSQLAETSFGQGDTLLSPLQMALACAAIANEGIIMKPYLVKELRNPEGEVIRVTESTPWLTATTPEIAQLITQGMVAAVEWGTGTAAAIKGIKVAGKTGTAETKNEQDQSSAPHAWFVGFAPADNPQVVVAVIVEKGGSGSRVAAPIAREVMAAALYGQ